MSPQCFLFLVFVAFVVLTTPSVATEQNLILRNDNFRTSLVKEEELENNFNFMFPHELGSRRTEAPSPSPSDEPKTEGELTEKNPTTIVPRPRATPKNGHRKVPPSPAPSTSEDSEQEVIYWEVTPKNRHHKASPSPAPSPSEDSEQEVIYWQVTPKNRHRKVPPSPAPSPSEDSEQEVIYWH